MSYVARIPALALAGLLLPSLSACTANEPGPAVGQRLDEIRNGTREPEAVALTEAQILALGWLYTTGTPNSAFCTGTIVSPTVVATAKHCVEGRRARDISFGIGLQPADPYATFASARIHAHPELDVAVLVLNTDVVEAVPEIEVIPFNREPLDNSLVGRDVQAGGYGQTYDRRRTGRYFATVELTNVRATEVVVDGNGQQGICFGDSGGPVITLLGEEGAETPFVLGVESWGDPSCVGVDHLTRLDVVADWIDEVTGDNPPMPDACGDLDYLGRCDGTVAEWCGDDTIERRDCADRRQVCAYIDDQQGHFCVEPPNNCGDIASSGVCQGEVVVRCRFGELVEEDCAANDESCSEDAGGAFCTPPWPPAQPTPEDAGVDAEPEPELDAGVDASPEPEEAGQERDKADSGCSTAPSQSSGALPLIALLGLLGLRRRKRGA